MYKYNSFSGVCHWVNTRKLATFEISCLKFEISCLKNCFRIKCGPKRIIVLGSVQNQNDHNGTLIHINFRVLDISVQQQRPQYCFVHFAVQFIVHCISCPNSHSISILISSKQNCLKSHCMKQSSKYMFLEIEILLILYSRQKAICLRSVRTSTNDTKEPWSRARDLLMNFTLR